MKKYHADLEPSYDSGGIVYHGQWWLWKRLAAIVFAFGIAPYLLVRYIPEFNEWFDKNLDKSDQQKTGIVILIVGCTIFSIAFLVKCLKR